MIAEGTEAGGHVGEFTDHNGTGAAGGGTDVLAAGHRGGIADGRQLLAAFALGAAGAQLGTCLLVSEECPVHPAYKQAILKAKDTDTTVTGRIAGTLRAFCTNGPPTLREKAGADKMELEEFTLGSLRRAALDGDTETGSLIWARWRACCMKFARCG